MTRPVKLLVAPAVLIAVVASLTACGTTTIDSGKAEKVIKQSIVEQTGVKVTAVVCPKDVEAKKGKTFTCTAKGADGTSAAVAVTQQDNEGNVNFKARLIDQTKVESTIANSVAEQSGKRVESVDCPDVVAIKMGYKYNCKVVGTNGNQANAEVALTDDTGQFDYTLK